MARRDHGQPGIYNSTALSLSTGEGSALATDAAGRLITNPGGFTTYESKSFTITGAQTNYNVATQQTMFATSKRSMSITSDIASTIKLNAATNDGIALGAGEQLTIDGYTTSNVFITTTGNTVVRIISFA